MQTCGRGLSVFGGGKLAETVVAGCLVLTVIDEAAGSSLFAGAGAAMTSAAVADGDVISAIATVESAEGDVSIEAVMVMP